MREKPASTRLQIEIPTRLQKGIAKSLSIEPAQLLSPVEVVSRVRQVCLFILLTRRFFQVSEVRMRR